MKHNSKTYAAVGDEMQPLRSAELTGAVPARVLLAPWGSVETTNGNFVIDGEAAELAVRAFDEHGTDLPIDYEHQTLGGSYASPSGQAPAAGWIKRVIAEPGVGLLADIEWTPQAREMLSAREYRYLSPVAVIRKSDRKLVAVHSAALTNKPAIVGMLPIVSRQSSGVVEVGAASDRIDGGSPLESLRAELDLPVDAGAEVVLLAAGQRIAELEQSARLRHVQERVQAAMREGKLVSAQRAWAEALVAREEGLFDEWLRTVPVVVQTGAIAPPGRGAAPLGREAIAARARAEFRSNPMLAKLTSEDAFVASAVREIVAA